MRSGEKKVEVGGREEVAYLRSDGLWYWWDGKAWNKVKESR